MFVLFFGGEGGGCFFIFTDGLYSADDHHYWYLVAITSFMALCPSSGLLQGICCALLN